MHAEGFLQSWLKQWAEQNPAFPLLLLDLRFAQMIAHLSNMVQSSFQCQIHEQNPGKCSYLEFVL